MSDGKKATVVITYNSVRDYPAGIYQGRNGEVIIHSNENTSTWGEDAAPAKMQQVAHRLQEITPEEVEKVYVYVGWYAMNDALQTARRLAQVGNKLKIVACDCEAGYKSDVAARLKAPIIWSECSGRRTLGEIVRKELGE